MNVIALMGRTTTDIELKTTANGVSVASFSLAVDRKYTPKGQERQTDFINCVAWRSNAEFISKWFRKGDMVAVEGELQMKKYTDKNGIERTAHEVVIENAYFCGGKKNTNQQDSQPNVEGAEPARVDQPEYEIITDDDLPF